LTKRLKELRILVFGGPFRTTFLMAEPVRGILRYLLEEAKPASAETVQELHKTNSRSSRKKLRSALDADDPTFAELALADITQSLRRVA